MGHLAMSGNMVVVSLSVAHTVGCRPPSAWAWPGLEDASGLAGTPAEVSSLGWATAYAGVVWTGLGPVDRFEVEGIFPGHLRQEHPVPSAACFPAA